MRRSERGVLTPRSLLGLCVPEHDPDRECGSLASVGRQDATRHLSHRARRRSRGVVPHGVTPPGEQRSVVTVSSHRQYLQTKVSILPQEDRSALGIDVAGQRASVPGGCGGPWRAPRCSSCTCPSCFAPDELVKFASIDFPSTHCVTSSSSAAGCVHAAAVDSRRQSGHESTPGVGVSRWRRRR